MDLKKMNQMKKDFNDKVECIEWFEKLPVHHMLAMRELYIHMRNTTDEEMDQLEFKLKSK